MSEPSSFTYLTSALYLQVTPFICQFVRSPTTVNATSTLKLIIVLNTNVILFNFTTLSRLSSPPSLAGLVLNWFSWFTQEEMGEAEDY